MRTLGLVFLSASAAICLGGPSGRPRHVLHEKRNHDLDFWERTDRAPRDHVLRMRVGLKQRNIENGESFVLDVSDPSSPNYGKHWTRQKVAETFAPSPETSGTTIKWLVESGISRDRLSFSPGKNWIQFDATVTEAEALLDTQYHLFESEQGESRVGCNSYGLPEHIQEHVDLVMPTVHLDSMDTRPAKKARSDLMVSADDYISHLNGTQLCNRIITIDCLRALYNFGPGNYSHAGNQLGIPEWAEYLYLPDLPIFFNNFTSPAIPNDTVPEFISIDGGRKANVSADIGGEAALDIQTAYSIIWPQNTRLYQMGDGVNINNVGSFNILLDALDASYCTTDGGNAPYIDPDYPDHDIGGYTGPLQCGGAPMSNVFTVSYGQIEGALPVFYQKRQCNEWMKLALQGVTVLFASGDSGVANCYNGGYNSTCLNAEKGYLDQYGTVFSPDFPANCPYITSVGGTELNGSIQGGEVAAADKKKNPFTDYYSGGGFSAVFPRPSWQDGPVKEYLDKYAPKYAEGVFARGGRAYPDLAAMSRNISVVIDGKLFGMGGTSVAAPIVAGLITLINEERLQAGLRPVGFINPVLYAHPEMFQDITSGSNPGCGTEGFPASPGWDAVTGMGTPNYEKMKAVFMSLP